MFIKIKQIEICKLFSVLCYAFIRNDMLASKMSVLLWTLHSNILHISVARDKIILCTHFNQYQL